jgi:hypothetical protein
MALMLGHEWQHMLYVCMSLTSVQIVLLAAGKILNLLVM